MKITNFEQYIDQRILSRGYAYFLNNKVSHFKKTGNTIEAQVQGSETYSVLIETDGKGTIIQTNCDCPHDAEICKHIIAVMYKSLHEVNAVDDIGHHQVILNYLDTLSKEEILDWLKQRLVHHPEVSNWWVIHTTKSLKQPDVIQIAIDFIRKDEIRLERMKYKNEYQVSYEEIEEATEHIDELLELASSHSDPVVACKLYLMLYETFEGYINYPSLSDSMDSLMEEVKDGIIELFNKEHTIEVQKLLFDQIGHFINIALSNPPSEDRILSLLFLIIPYIKSIDQKDLVLHWMNQIDSLLTKANSTYYEDQMVQLQKMLIFHTESKENYQAFLYSHLQYHEIRSELLNDLINRKDYFKAIEVANEGLNTNIGYQNIWEGFLFDIFMKQNEITKAKRIALDLIERGYSQYLDPYQHLFSEVEWQVELDRIIELSKKTKNKQLYSKMIYQYHRKADVIEYIQTYPAEITSLIKYVDSTDYPIFEKIVKNRIFDQLSSANNRKDYRRLKHTIDFYGQLYGPANAKQIKGDIIISNPRKPALIDELS
ncbi:MAG: SWIM zinc finger family protein [Candidatus Izemoplasmatales bacterium]|nr:SWIM zinc finger family protein [Candidatus Izemoplasmatales bacterium]